MPGSSTIAHRHDAWAKSWYVARVLGGVLGVVLTFASAAGAQPAMQWHRYEASFAGPTHAESDSTPNPFLDYRLQCTLTAPSGRTSNVPGFFDTNGTGAQSGASWKCRFAPDEVGTWSYSVSFRSGPDVAISLSASAGTPAFFDGTSGSFQVTASDKMGRDFRAPEHGRLQNFGTHYLQFAGGGDAWVKGGPDIPENFLGYTGFENTPDAGHSFSAHVADWNAGDPDWGGGAGRAIIGALNYIASTGANCIYFLPMNVGGDGDDTFPTIARTDKLHYDAGKLLQWESVFTHADRLGIFLHVQLCERENENYHDGGTLGRERKLYYRELVARFGHHLGIEWDLGEENNYGSAKHEEFAAWIRAQDPYDHPVTVHTKDNQEEEFYAPLLGNADFAMTAFQTSATGLGAEIIDWRERSSQAGVPWVISVDEPGGIQNDPNDTAQGYPFGRTQYMWPVYASGGGGFEWYVEEDGGGHGFDQRIDDMREMDPALTWTGHALEFLRRLSLLDTAPAPALSDADYTLADPGRAYGLYTRTRRSISVNLTGYAGSFSVRWMNPRSGAWFDGPTVAGGGWRSIGMASFVDDAAALVIDDDVICDTNADCAPGPQCGPQICQGNVCAPQGLGTCDDHNDCTDDACNEVDGCTHSATSGGTCNDGDVCSVTDTCESGQCSATDTHPTLRNTIRAKLGDGQDDDSLRLQATLPIPDFTSYPDATGLELTLHGADGAVLLSATIPPGAFEDAGGTLTRFRFQDPDAVVTSAQGITSAVLKIAYTKRIARVKIKGNHMEIPGAALQPSLSVSFLWGTDPEIHDCLSARHVPCQPGTNVTSCAD